MKSSAGEGNPAGTRLPNSGRGIFDALDALHTGNPMKIPPIALLSSLEQIKNMVNGDGAAVNSPI